jgi:hypothetical protein
MNEWKEIFSGLWRFKNGLDVVKLAEMLPLAEAVDGKKQTGQWIDADYEIDIVVRKRVREQPGES